MRREERVTVQGPVKEQQPEGMSHRGGGMCPLLRTPSAAGTRPSPTSSSLLQTDPTTVVWGEHCHFRVPPTLDWEKWALGMTLNNGDTEYADEMLPAAQGMRDARGP